MLKLDENYSDYVDMDNPDYPEGAAKNASSSESYDGTPLLASFMNNVVGAFQGMWKKAYGDTKGISGSADTVDESQFVNAIEKFAKDMVKAHADLRGENAHGAKVTADPGQIVTRNEFGNAKFGVPMANDDAARRGDIYDLTKGVLCITPAENFAKEIPAEKFPGFKLNNETVVKVLFQSGCEKATEEFDEETDIFTINFCETGAKKVFAKKDGEIILLGNHVIDNKTKVFQSYTEMELMYLTSLDEGNGGWLVLNNPIVLSNSDATSGYTVLADGEKVYNARQINDTLEGYTPKAESREDETLFVDGSSISFSWDWLHKKSCIFITFMQSAKAVTTVVIVSKILSADYASGTVLVSPWGDIQFSISTGGQFKILSLPIGVYINFIAL